MADHSTGWRPSEANFRNAAEITRLQRHMRTPPAFDHVEALEMLYERMVESIVLYETSELPKQREAIVGALCAVEAFLKLQGFAPATLAPLMRPVAALIERDSGSLDYLFAERTQKQGGKPKSTTTDHERKGILSTFAEKWLESHQEDGRNQRERLAECAAKLKGRWFGHVSRAELKTALDFVRREASDHPAVMSSKHFSNLYAYAERLFGAQNAFRIMVRSLNDVELPFGAGEGGIAKTPTVSSSV